MHLKQQQNLSSPLTSHHLLYANSRAGKASKLLFSLVIGEKLLGVAQFLIPKRESEKLVLLVYYFGVNIA
jgi:hypothetical protein